MSLNIELRMIDGQGVEYVTLPDYESLNMSPVFCDAGTIEFSYPKDGANFASLAARDEFSLAIYVGGVRRGKLDCIIMDTDGDDVSETSVWKFTGFFNNGRLAEAMTYPAGWPTVDPKAPDLVFTNATAGTIMRTLIQQAKDRGGLLWLTMASFSSTLDSNGVAWNKQLSVTYAPGVSYLTIIRNLHEQGMCEFEFDGLALRMYVAGGMSIDRTLLTPAPVFRQGRDLIDSPRKRTTRTIGTALLGAGSDGLYVEATNPTQIVARRRVEMYESQGNIGDQGSLLAIAQTLIEQVSEPKMEKTHGLTFEDFDSPEPLQDFNVGDWVFSDMGAGTERLRVKQWVIAINSKGEVTGSVTLNDYFAERAEALSRRVDGIVGGSSITGASRAVDIPDGEIADTMPPKTPTGLGASSTAYVDPGGQTYAQITATWVQVTANADNTILEDLRSYIIAWRVTSLSQTGWNLVEAGTATTASWSPVAPGQTVEVRVAAEDTSGNLSGWSTSYFLTSGSDSTPPPVPSTPLVDNYLGMLRIRWDGLNVASAAFPPDFSHIEVHSSNVNNFTPSATTRVGTLTAAGSVFLKTPYGVTQYAKFISADYNKNKSAASAQASGAATQLVATDIENNIIDLEKVAFKDQNNLVEDGSFRIDSLNTTRAAQSGWAIVTGETAGSKAFQWGVGDTFLTLRKTIPVIPGEQYMARFQHKANSVSPGTAKIAINYTCINSAGTTVGTFYGSQQAPPTQTTWGWSTPLYFTVPANTATMDVFARVEGATAGTWDMNQVEVRRVIGTVLIEDAAIVNAKIGLLAVNSANISDLSVGKLTAGIMSAEVTVSGRLATALTGRRVEMNGVGFQGWDAGGNQTISLDGLNNLLTGRFRTAVSGRRVEMQAGGSLSQVDFWSPAALRSYVRSFTESAGIEAIQIGTGDPTANGLDSRININSTSYATHRFRVIELVAGESFRLFSAFANYPNPIIGMDSASRNVTFDVNNFYVFGDGDNYMEGNQFSFLVRPAPTAPVTLEFPNNGHLGVDYGNAYFGGRWAFQSSLAFTNSPRFSLFTRDGYGGVMKFAGNVNFQEMEFKYFDDSFYISLRASGFIPMSDRSTKDEISDYTDSSMALVRGTKVRKYRRKKLPDENGERPMEVGIIAQEAPPQIVSGMEGSLGVDLYQMTTLLWKATQELDARLNVLEADKKKANKK